MTPPVAEPIPVGARLFDSLPFSLGGDASGAAALVAPDAAAGRGGADGIVGYLGTMTQARAAEVLAAGMGLLMTTVACAWDGAAAVAQARAIGYPVGCCVVLDVEDQESLDLGAAGLAAKIAAWAATVKSAGYVPSIYVGVPQPLSSEELWRLPVVRYWRGCGRIVDAADQLAEPSGCGWCMTQAWDSIVHNGIKVDANISGLDYLGRSMIWCRSLRARGGPVQRSIPL